MKLNNTDKVYHDLLKDIVDNGHEKGDRTGTGTTSVFGRQIRFNMKDGFPVLTTKRLHLRSIIHELLWFLNGDTNIKYLNDNKVTIWDEWADENGDLGPVYGKQWVDWNGRTEVKFGPEKDKSGHLIKSEVHNKGINQIQQAIDRLNTVPDCRRILISAWNVAELKDMKLMPCHYGLQLWTRELSFAERRDLAQEYAKENNKLPLAIDAHGRNGIPQYMDTINSTGWDIPKREISLMMNQRSIDTGLGLPFNIASYGLLLEMFAQQTNMVASELIMNLGDTHIYNNHTEQVEEQLKRDSKTMVLPKLKLKKADSIFDYKFEDFEILNYDAHPSIKMPIAV
tara:strand:+ start:259 stop:1278 length:1020 start_codon:yes stop_codon:yes gene_type:complete